MAVMFGAINISVATLWTEPGVKRPYDDLILGSPANPAAWAGGMDNDMRLWLVDRVETQALYGERVAILEEQDDWLKIAVIPQRTPCHELGYPGWVPAAQVTVNSSYLEDQLWLPEVVITKQTVHLYSDADITNPEILLSYQTRLPVIEEHLLYWTVRLPDGEAGYLVKSEARTSATLSFSADNIVAEAQKFLGLRYLWGGTSAFGFDCSGFTYRLYQSQGINIPRDASDQASEGLAVAKNELVPGDLLFFSSDGTQEGIHHVGMFAGDSMMLHAPNSRLAIKEDPFDGIIYGGEYWGARRYSTR